ncbi:phage holin family protein [Candidatus Woesebacteria bacterium]|nr:phage holin family protein [Candidatus Woesebacteria bacterium]
MGIIVSLLINSLAVGITVYLLHPHVQLDGYMSALVVAVVMGVINTFIKPVVKILTLPINLLTLGLFSMVINGLLILLTDRFVSGFHVENLMWAIVFSFLLSIVNSVLGIFK